MLAQFEKLTESEQVDAFVLTQNVSRAKKAMDKANLEYNDALPPCERGGK